MYSQTKKEKDQVLAVQQLKGGELIPCIISSEADSKINPDLALPLVSDETLEDQGAIFG